MLTIALLVLFFFSISRGRFLYPESILNMPWVLGCVLFSLTGQMSFYPSYSEILLFIFIFIEYFFLHIFSYGAVFGSGNPQTSLFNKSGLIIVFTFLFLPASVYLLKIFHDISLAESFGGYIFKMRTLAHAGGGIDYSNPIIYRVINLGLACSLLMFDEKFMGKIKTRNFYICFGMILVVFLSSVMEGNRSNLIYYLLCFFIAYASSIKIKYFRLFLAVFTFIVLFSISMPLFRLKLQLSWTSFMTGLEYFCLYAFGSILSFPKYVDFNINQYWGTFDIIVQKFAGLSANLFGAKPFFFIDYVKIFNDKFTNVYSGYSMINNYLGISGMILFLFLKSMGISLVFRLRNVNTFFSSAYYILAVSLALTIFNEYLFTAMYLIFNLAIVWIILRLASRLFSSRLKLF